MSLSRQIAREQATNTPQPRPVNRAGALTNLFLIDGDYLYDNLALDELAATAEKLKRWEFMVIVEPLRVQNGAGSAVNPVAVF